MQSADNRKIVSALQAERQGFEPWVPKGTTVLETAPIDHSGIFPRKDMLHLVLNAVQKYAILPLKQNLITKRIYKLCNLSITASGSEASKTKLPVTTMSAWA